MNLPSGNRVVLSTWISSEVVTVHRREEGPWEVFFIMIRTYTKVLELWYQLLQ